MVRRQTTNDQCGVPAGLWRRAHLLAHGDSGESLVSFALSIVVLFGLIFGLVQICFAYYSYEMISELAREGTRYAVVHGSTCETSTGSSCTVKAPAVNSYVSGIGLPKIGGGTLTAATTYPGGMGTTGCPDGAGSEAPGCYVQVTVSYCFPYKVPLLLSSKPLTMSSTSKMIIIQ
jgi:Flp pilus assembly protein TadG